MMRPEYLMILQEFQEAIKNLEGYYCVIQMLKTVHLARLFGKSEIELVQVKDRKPKSIYEGRIWGDPGFIHLCYDINDMDALREKAKNSWIPVYG